MENTSSYWNSIVPQPKSVKFGSGHVSIDELYLSGQSLHGSFAMEAKRFKERHLQLNKDHGVVHIHFKEQPDLGEEEYHIDISREGVWIYAGTAAGAFYATITLSQWLWQQSALPVAKLHDLPRFSWRGYMLDVSRNFFPASYIKELMQQLAAYKINRLHLHLSDDQGWRLPIESYPKLIEVGSKCYGAFDHLYNKEPELSGFYTKEQIQELNELAAGLHMSIVPEIDLPGHAAAAIASYPELMCAPFQEQDLKILPLRGISRNVLCLGKQYTWDFVYAVLDEVVRLFPGPYIHLGGDEVPRHHWKECPDCQKLMQTEALKDCDGLQNLFTQRCRDYIHSKQKQPLFWDEVEESGLSEGTICCFWRSWPQASGDGRNPDSSWDIAAARKGVPVISCPVSGAYLDYKHNNKPAEAGNIGVATVYDSYHFSLLADQYPNLAEYNLGVQANLWTEYVYFAPHIEYMTYPRLLAIAEQGWQKGGWALFKEKWPMQQITLEALGVQNYYRGAWQ